MNTQPAETVKATETEIKEMVVKLSGLLNRFMSIRNNIEVMGEWSALDINPTRYKKESAKVDTLMQESWDAVNQAKALIPDLNKQNSTQPNVDAIRGI